MDAQRLIGLVLVSACVAGFVSISTAGAAQATNAADPEQDPNAVDCATVTASARMQAYGYAHVVTLSNHCARAVSCEVWTDVDPSPHYTLTAKAGQRAEVITRNGSPAREVQAGKQCRYAGQG